MLNLKNIKLYLKEDIISVINDLSNEDFYKISVKLFIVILLLFPLGFLFGSLYVGDKTLNNIEDNLIIISEKEGNIFPYNNYFRINDKFFEIKEINLNKSIYNLNITVVD